ncbi:MAG: TIGR03620 family F420-dependent LLM class oxidoreductase [Proteobacteria bacterium]|nr:MAG: TIGR03620 family F420-dependent LLM class oxidoreductase [Pseudomonadota bacterium]
MIMPPKSLGVFLYPDNFSALELGDFARRFEKLGYASIWYPEAMFYESFTVGGYLLSQTERIVVASGIANIYARDAMATLACSRGLQKFYPDRYITGLGVSHKSLVEDLRGHTYRKPMAAMIEYLDNMDACRPKLAGVDTPLVLAALGPKMIQLAGERSDGAHPFNSPPEHTRWARELIGPDKWICTAQHVCLTTDPALARSVARRALEFYFATPNHYRNWLRVGYDTSDLENGGSNRLIDALVAWGSEAQIRDRIQQHFDAGATQVIINTISPDGPGAGENAIDGHNFQSAPHWETYERLAPKQTPR